MKHRLSMSKSLKIAIVRGAHLNKFEMQYYLPLLSRHKIIGFCSLKSIHDRFPFPVVKLPSPKDITSFLMKFNIPQKLSLAILNRIFIDAEHLFGLEKRLAGFDIAHSAETYHFYTQQCLNAKRRGLVKKVVCSVFENIPFANEGIWDRRKLKQRTLRKWTILLLYQEGQERR